MKYDRHVPIDLKIKERWVAALRSGDYEQARNTLRNKKGAMCCIGVLCEIQGRKWEWDDQRDAYVGAQLIVTPETSEYAGAGGGNFRPLARMNDRGDSFTQIADYIEENL